MRVGLTQRQVADFLNLKLEVYRRYETGIYEVPVWVIVRLACGLYNCSTDILLGLKNKD